LKPVEAKFWPELKAQQMNRKAHPNAAPSRDLNATIGNDTGNVN
jgi:hypothetical protein